MEAPEVASIEAEREAEVEEIERDYFWGDCKDALAFREGAQICKGATPTTPSPASRAFTFTCQCQPCLHGTKGNLVSHALSGSCIDYP
jgi:hypothetical protein